jgi:hypothetical protein
MRAAAFFCCAVVVAGCGKADNRAAETSNGDTGMAGAPDSSATVSLADFAGKWKTRSRDETGKIVGEADLLATADTSGWTLTFPRQKPIHLRVVAVGGDSVVTEAGPYRSSRIKGAQITSRAVNRLQGGRLVTTVEGKYSIGGRDSVVHMTVEGSRSP